MKNILPTLTLLMSGLFSTAAPQDSASTYQELIPELTPVIHADNEPVAYSDSVFAQPTQISPSADFATVLSTGSYEAGEIEVTSGNSQSGAKTYTVPIKVAGGINESMTPRISLSYNSQQGSGILGTGWSLTGLSSITRVAKSIYYDGYSEGIRLNDDDAFSLDGIRLIALEKSGSEVLFQTERGNIKAKGYIQNGDVRYFDVYYPDGKKGEFRPISPNSLVFPIVRLYDQRNNQVEYRYNYDQSLGISMIIYNGNRIEFGYEDNVSEKTDSYRGGKKFSLSSRLTEISCYYKSSPIGKYSLNYTFSGVKALLSSVAYEAGGKELPPLRFYYDTPYNATVKLNSTSSLLYSFKNARIVKGRFDYETGSDGIICLPEKNSYYCHSPLSGKYYYHNEYHPKDSIFIYQDVQTAYPDLIGILEAGEGLVDIFCADLTGNQTEDIVKVNNVVNGDVEKLTFSVYTLSSFGTHLRYKREYTLSTVNDMKGVKSILPKFFHVGDFDGDGQMEIFAVSAYNAFKSNPQPSKCYIFELEEEPTSLLRYEGELLEYTHIFIGNASVSSQDLNNGTDKLYVIDYDGDGKSDICHINESGTDIYTFVKGPFGTLTGKKVSTCTSINKSSIEDRTVIPCDMNGDGITDLVISSKYGGSSSTWSLRKGDGAGSFELSSFGAPANNMYKEGYGFTIQDINSDGVADLISTTPYSSSIFAGTTDGFAKTAFASLTHSAGEDIRIVPTSLVSRNSFSSLLIYRYRHSDSKCTLSAYGCTVNESLQTLCVGMMNSLGVTEYNTYTLATDRSSGVCRRGYGAVYPYANIFEPMPLLSQVRTTHHATELSKETLAYENPVVHRQGLGFQGFGAVTRMDYRGLTFRQEYDTGNRGALLVDITPTDSTKYEYLIERTQNGLLNILPKQVRVRNLVDDFVTVTDMSYDEFGNLTGKTVAYPDGARATETNIYINNDDISTGFCIGLPRSSTKTLSFGQPSITEKVSVTSYDRGLPSGKTVTRNGLPLKEQTFEYYDNGLTKSVTERAYTSDKSFKTAYEYDSGNKLLRITDPMGFSADYTYYADNGLLRTVTDKTGKTEIAYDGFGREVLRSDPVNPQIATIYEWASNRPYGYQTVTTKTNGTPSVTYFDALNRPIRQVNMRIDGKESATTIGYDRFGNIESVSYPHSPEYSPSIITEFSYDLLGRKLSETSPSGKRITYTYGKLTTTENVNGIETVRKFDCRGNLIGVSDPSGQVTYELGADGQPDRITSPEGAVMTFIYDGYRRLVSRTDPSIGTETFAYDSDGNMKSQTNARGQTTTYTYDEYNRVIAMSTPEMTVSYTYDPNSGYMTAAVTTDGFSRSLGYDAQGRVASSKESFEGHSAESTYSYGAGLLRQAFHKSDKGFEIKENYRYNYGHLTEIVLNDTVSVLRRTKVNDFDQVTEMSCGGMSTIFSYDEYGSLTRRQNAWGDEIIADAVLDFDPYTGNLLSRKDNLRGLTESFEYDGLNRLANYGEHFVEYSDNGNIEVKSDVGAFVYGHTAKPYAVTAALFISPDIPTRTQDIKYTSFMRPSVLAENGHTSTSTYGPEFNRIKARHEQESQYRSQSYYLGGNYEFENISLMELASKVDPVNPHPLEPFLPGTYGTNGGITMVDPGIGGSQDLRQTEYDIERFYIGGDAYTAPAVMVKSTRGKGSLKIYLIVRDHVGSIVALVNADGGKVEQELSYDAWGRLRDPKTQTVYASGKEPKLILGRGYGSHEYLPNFGLVNMNARLYDPVLGRFLSPDPYVQDPTLPQNFNRYSYCLNNPLLYCDQSGEWFGLDDLFVAAVGFVSGYLSNAISTGNWGWSSIKGGLTGAAMCWLGYNTAGLATGAITSSTLTHAGQIGLSSLAANFIPSVSVPLIDNWGISISPLIGFGTGGFSFGGALSVYGKIGDNYVGIGLSLGGNAGTETKYVGFNVMYGSDEFRLGYGQTFYGSGTVNGHNYEPQTVGNISIGWKDGSFSISNDLFAEKNDRFRTTSAELVIKNFSIGTYVDTNNGFADNENQRRRESSCEAEKSKSWDKGIVYAAPVWVGYKQGDMISRAGIHSKLVQQCTQNFIHSIIGSKHYKDYSQMTRGIYSYYGNINPFSLWNY